MYRVALRTSVFKNLKFNFFIFEMFKKKIWANFQKIIELFTQKIVTKLSKIWVWYPGSEIRDPRSEIRDPGSGKNLFRIPDPGCRGQKGIGSRIRIRYTDGHTIFCKLLHAGILVCLRHSLVNEFYKVQIKIK